MNKYITVGILLIVIVLVIVFREKLTALFTKANAAPATPPAAVPTPPAALNLTLLLKRGSTGPEVKVLQSYLGVTADGQFGPITENALLAKKGIKEVTLANYNQLPEITTIETVDDEGNWTNSPIFGGIF